MYKCKQCDIATDLFFCPNCGRVLKFPQFIEDDKMQENRLQSYIKVIINDAIAKKVNISTYANVRVLSDAMFRKYNEHILYLQEMCAKSNGVSFFRTGEQSMIELMRDFADKCKTNECQISMAGKIRSGKSTFINALLGKEVASTHPTSETAVLTKFRYSEEGDYVKVSYYKTDEWDVLWQSVMSANQDSIRNDQGDFLSEYNRLSADEIRTQQLNKPDDIFSTKDDAELRDVITKYTSSKSPYHFFAKEVEIGLSTFAMPKNVVLVDTLGLDDPVSYRADIANQNLRSANIILLCVKATRAQLHPHELEKIAILFSELNSKDQLYILGTQYDTPNEFSKYWTEKTKPTFIKSFSGKQYFGSEEQSKDRILPISAWYYNIIQQAKNDATFWESEYHVDYLAEVLCRCLGSSRAYQFGTDSSALKRCMNEHLIELESRTNIPNVINFIMFGTIRDAERKTLDDFKGIYRSICDNLKENTIHQGIISSSNLKFQMAALDSKISKNHEEQETKIKSIKVILQSLQTTYDGCVSSLNFTNNR